MSQLLSFASTLKYIGYIFIAILILLFMVLIHELGHYIAGKILKFKITLNFTLNFQQFLLECYQPPLPHLPYSNKDIVYHWI